jgi:hypothetical protein
VTGLGNQRVEIAMVVTPDGLGTAGWSSLDSSFLKWLLITARLQ